MKDYKDCYLPEISFDNGDSIPCCGIGTYGLIKDDLFKLLVKYPCKRLLLDTANRYGNEREIGTAIRKAEFPQSKIVIIGKISYKQQDYLEVRKAVEESIENLGIAYFDIYLIHSPRNEKYLYTWEKMIDINKTGIIKHIGVSNFGIRHLQNIYDNFGTYPEVNQIVPNSLTLEELKALINFCQSNNIMIQVAQPFGGKNNLLGRMERRAILLELYNRNIISILGTHNYLHMLENLDVFIEGRLNV